MDLNHGLAFAGSSMKIYAGEDKDCQDADHGGHYSRVAQRQGRPAWMLFKEKYPGVPFYYRASDSFWL